MINFEKCIQIQIQRNMEGISYHIDYFYSIGSLDYQYYFFIIGFTLEDRLLSLS